MTNNHKDIIEKVKSSLIEDISKCSTVKELELTNIKYLGRQGEVNKLFKSLPIKENPLIGKEINELKNLCSKLLSEMMTQLLNQSSKDSFDVTVPGIQPHKGSKHLITQAIEEIERIFSQIGFVRRRYPEVETDWYYAEGLNIPKDHPARDDQETFYLSDDVVLTAHTSNGQLREMERVKKPPIKMINISKTYRRQADTSHNTMFHQFEGLLVDKNINITNLIGVMDYFAKAYFGQDRTIRLRPHHFQFTEPSFEIDISCGLCHGKGKVADTPCKFCKSGWLELGGSGMVHPNVLKNGGLDPNIYSGFAFGWGVERVLMMKSGLNLPDLRLLYTDDLRFLKQF
ncbi:MAG TPA: phenylalanine--tRNA ligase subunit alpha [Spirochaetia bacterium]|nr:phenylalanine--tRNA ligase subunit alpha [Spirochaetia bacterium]